MQGYNVIPLKGGEPGNENFKRPAILWEKYQRELSTIADIRRWYEENPSLVFGIVTGPVSQLFVVDLDSEESAAAFFALNGNAECVKIRTRKGWHVYYRWADALSNKVTTRVRLKDKLDIRGEGGYVVAWDLEALPELNKLPAVPQWILDLLPNRGESKGTVKLNRDWLADAFANLKEGNRNDTFTRIAGSFRARGYSATGIYGVLLPWAEKVGFPPEELRTICQSVGRYAPTIRDGADIGDSKTLTELLRNRPPVEWLIDDLIPKQGLVFFAGLEGSGKSWLTADLAIEAARDAGLWLGRFPVKQCKVLYIEQERSEGETLRRFAALSAQKELPLQKLDDTLKLKLKAGLYIENDDCFQALRKELGEYRPDLVIVDSFGTFTTKDTNSGMDMVMVTERLKELRNEFKCTFVFVYHEGKGAWEAAKDRETGVTHQFMAGSAVLARAAETIFIVRHKGGKESMCHQTKNNPGEIGAPFLYTYVNVTPDKSKIEVKVL